MDYMVVVGNVGMVHEGSDYAEAKEVFDDYVALSKGNVGRTAGESIMLFEDEEPIEKHDPRCRWVDPDDRGDFLYQKSREEEA